METKLCEAKHERIDEKLAIHDKRLDNHGERLDRMELTTGRMEERLDGLIMQLSNLTTTLKWFIGLMVGAFVGFFFYAVQSGILR